MAQTLVDVIIKNTGSLKGDSFWDNSESNLLKALVLYVMLEYPEENRNMGEVYQLLIRADIRSITDADQLEKLNRCTLQARYAGIITDIRGGRLYIRLSNGVNAIAETCYDSRTPGKRDEVSFVLTKINTERRIAYGIVARIIRQNLV